MDFVFDRTGEGRVLKYLTIVDDAALEAIATEVERAISGLMLTRFLDRLALCRGLPQVIRTEIGKPSCGKALVEPANAATVDLRLIEPGKPNQNVYIESFNSRLHDECLNEHWFTNHLQARTIIETWRREYDEETPKIALGGLTPAAYANQLAQVRLQQYRTRNSTATESGGGRRVLARALATLAPRSLITAAGSDSRFKLGAGWIPGKPDGASSHR